jgi:guanosine-3',5'-bis(diphosphate) 3'-pyrophosphohydrolase
MTDLQDFLRAAAFAARKHRLQKRKDAEASPYINHPLEVAAILAGEGGVTDPVTLVAAVLHDTLEDTKTTPEELATAFSPTIRDLVQELTDDKRLPKPERKARQVAGAPHLSARAKLIRIADKIANVRDVTHHPPAHWDLARRQGYLDWTEQVVAGCRGSNPRLDTTYDHVLREGRALLASPKRPMPDD